MAVFAFGISLFRAVSGVSVQTARRGIARRSALRRRGLRRVTPLMPQLGERRRRPELVTEPLPEDAALEYAAGEVRLVVAVVQAAVNDCYDELYQRERRPRPIVRLRGIQVQVFASRLTDGERQFMTDCILGDLPEWVLARRVVSPGTLVAFQAAQSG